MLTLRRPLQLILLFLFIAQSMWLSSANSAPSQVPTTYLDPVSYCRAVGASDGPPDPRYVGPARVPWIEQAAGRTEDSQLVTWGCDGGAVVACLNFGVTGPCNEIDMSRSPNPGMLEFCREAPNSEMPAAVTGHYTAFDWYCLRGRPTIRRQWQTPDHRGYVPGDYKRVDPPQFPRTIRSGANPKPLVRLIGQERLKRLQRGQEAFQSDCSGCHRLGGIRFNDLREIGYTTQKITSIRSIFAGNRAPPPISDIYVGQNGSVEDDELRRFHFGALPPDLAKWTRRTLQGPERIFSLLSGYHSSSTVVTGGLDQNGNRFLREMWLSPYLPDGMTAMNYPLVADLHQGIGPGAEVWTTTQQAADVALFLEWAASKIEKVPSLNALPVSPLSVQFGFFNESYARSSQRQHLGVDIPLPVQTPVYTPVEGEVVANRTSASDVMQAFLVIREPSGSEQVFGHISSNLQVGDRLSAGMLIGFIRPWPGEPRRSHLHWGVNSTGVLQAMTGDWGFGRAPISVSREQASSRGWIDPETLLDE